MSLKELLSSGRICFAVERDQVRLGLVAQLMAECVQFPFDRSYGREIRLECDEMVSNIFVIKPRDFSSVLASSLRCLTKSEISRTSFTEDSNRF